MKPSDCFTLSQASNIDFSTVKDRVDSSAIHMTRILERSYPALVARSKEVIANNEEHIKAPDADKFVRYEEKVGNINYYIIITNVKIKTQPNLMNFVLGQYK